MADHTVMTRVEALGRAATEDARAVKVVEEVLREADSMHNAIVVAAEGAQAEGLCTQRVESVDQGYNGSAGTVTVLIIFLDSVLVVSILRRQM